MILYQVTFGAVPPRRREEAVDVLESYLPVDRADIGSWQNTYRDYDSIWIGSRNLEMAVYRELAQPDSELSQDGREIWRRVEGATGIPTYYYLMRYWGRRKGEETRPCPGCGGS